MNNPDLKDAAEALRLARLFANGEALPTRRELLAKIDAALAAIQPRPKSCHCGYEMGKGLCREAGAISCKELVDHQPADAAPDVEAIVQKAANSLCGFEPDADRRYWGSVQDDERHRKCCEVIRSAIARATAEGWISAKQSLPQDTRHVLVICEREHEDDARRRWFMRMAWRLMNSDGSFRGWWQVVGGDEQFADKIVRYWRELPQMPAILTEGKR